MIRFVVAIVINPNDAEVPVSIFIQLKLELLTQIPASTDEKYVNLWKTSPAKFNYLISWSSITRYFVDLIYIWFALKLAWHRIYTVPAAQGLTTIALPLF